MFIASTANSLARSKRVRTPVLIALAYDAKKLISWLTLVRKRWASVDFASVYGFSMNA